MALRLSHWFAFPQVDVVVVGAGAAGIGCAVSLTRAFGLDSDRVRILERSDTVGASFRAWSEEMRFISPSFNQQGWTSSFDLNAVAQDTSPAYALHAQHPSGEQYADYLAALADDANLDIRLGTEVRSVEKLADGDFDVHVRAGGADDIIRTRFVVWAAGEFQYPSTGDLPGAEFCVHNSKVESWAGLPGDERVAGAPLLTAEDESTKTPGVFLVGPAVVQGDLSFCFVYKFRQRFGIVADAICRGLGRDTRESVQGLRQANMYMNDLSCCENTCGEVC